GAGDAPATRGGVPARAVELWPHKKNRPANGRAVVHVTPCCWPEDAIDTLERVPLATAGHCVPSKTTPLSPTT
ncbi:MAG: hypothetical protein ACHQTF_06065, partial [Gemmatimonadales bacterium]